MRSMRNAVLVFLAVNAIIPFFACTRKTEDEKIRNVIEAVRKAAEDRNVKDVLAHVDKNYRDPQGNDFQGVRSLLLYYYFHNQKITIVVSNVETTVEGRSAKASFQAIFAGGSGASGGILPEGLSAYRFDVSFSKDGDDWKIASAAWERWGEAGQSESGQAK